MNGSCVIDGGLAICVLLYHTVTTVHSGKESKPMAHPNDAMPASVQITKRRVFYFAGLLKKYPLKWFKHGVDTIFELLQYDNYKTKSISR